MLFPVRDVADVVAEHQAQRYRAMSPAEKLAQADALFDLAWDAAKAGVRMRQPTLTTLGSIARFENSSRGCGRVHKREPSEPLLNRPTAANVS